MWEIQGYTHGVEHVGPAFEGDALEDGEHGEAEVVEVGDAVVRALPVLLRIADPLDAQALAVEAAGAARVRVLHHLAFNPKTKVVSYYFFFFEARFEFRSCARMICLSELGCYYLRVLMSCSVWLLE